MDTPGAVFRFGSYELRPSSRELLKYGTKLKIRPQPFQVLTLLLDRDGGVVTREELREKLWSRETFVDFEHGLNTAVKELRAIVGDSAGNPRYIETIPRLGYRFIASIERIEATKKVPAVPLPVAPIEPPALASDGVPAPLAVPLSGASAGRAILRQWWFPASVAVVLLVVFGVYLVRSHAHSGHTAAAGRTMLAVLPFTNLTGDAGQEYFSDGLTEEMITQLGRSDPQHLGVIARTSVMHYKNSQEQLRQIGSELGVQYVLEGSVRRDSNRVRITAQLIRVGDQTHIWAREYDRQLSSLLVVQGEIAQEISDEIQLTLGGEHPAAAKQLRTLSPSTSYEAYDLYLRGRYFWNKRTHEGFQQAASYFQQAIDKDPNYAAAYSGLADADALMSTWHQAPPTEAMPMARAAALKALQLDESLAEAHTSLALIEESYDYDWQAAEKEYRRAIQLDPGYSTAHEWYAECLSFEGRFNEALAESERAHQLDPLSLIIATDNGVILLYSRQYDRAIEQLRSVIDMDPKFERAYSIVYAYAQVGRFADALAAVENLRRAEGPTSAVWASQAYVYARWGKQKESREALAKVQALTRHSESHDPFVLMVYAALGQKDDAINMLRDAYAAHSSIMTSLKVDPIFDPLRDDPRYTELLSRVGLAQ